MVQTGVQTGIIQKLLIGLLLWSLLLIPLQNSIAAVSDLNALDCMTRCDQMQQGNVMQNNCEQGYKCDMGCLDCTFTSMTSVIRDEQDIPLPGFVSIKSFNPLYSLTGIDNLPEPRPPR